MTKKQQERELGELTARIRQFENDNQVVIQRYKRDGITLLDLYMQNEKLFAAYNKRWGYLKKNNFVVSK